MATIKKPLGKRFTPKKRMMVPPQQAQAPIGQPMQQGPPMAKKGKTMKKCCHGSKIKKGK